MFVSCIVMAKPAPWLLAGTRSALERRKVWPQLRQCQRSGAKHRLCGEEDLAAIEAAVEERRRYAEMLEADDEEAAER